MVWDLCRHRSDLSLEHAELRRDDLFKRLGISDGSVHSGGQRLHPIGNSQLRPKTPDLPGLFLDSSVSLRFYPSPLLYDPGDPLSVRAAEDGMGSSSRGTATASGMTAASTMGDGTYMYVGASIPHSSKNEAKSHRPRGMSHSNGTGTDVTGMTAAAGVTLVGVTVV